MDKKVLSSVLDQVYHRFPDYSGIHPKIQKREAQGNQAASESFLLVFHKVVKTENNRQLPKWLRVVVNSSGKIIKVSNSR